MSSKFEKLLDPYKLYYAASYPFKEIFQWLSYNGKITLENREWSYEALSTIKPDDKYVRRFVEVITAETLKNLAQPTQELKLKFDIGPVYDKPMNMRKSNIQYVPVQREFVFDIDADDFKLVRHCCHEKKMCTKCWRFMECACCILIHFCQTYAFGNYMFVFSGRRGLHCWITDDYARSLSAKDRQEMLFPFEVIKADNENEITITVPLQISGSVIKNICRTFFEIMFQEQEWFTAHIDTTMSAIQKIAVKLGMKESVVEKLKQLKGLSLIDQIKQSHPQLYELLTIYFTYPRFDINVTKSMNHLLKIPFSIHAETLNVSVPINHYEIVKHYGIDDIKFVDKYEGYQRFEVEKPIKIDGDLSEVLEFFRFFISKL